MLPPAPGTLRILHLSDTHITGDGALHQGSVDTRAALEALLTRVDGLSGVDLVVVSGDLSEDGSPESYTFLRDRLTAWASEHRAALVVVPGNHDGRAGFRQVLANGHLLGEGGTPLMHTLEHLPPEVPVAGTSDVAGRVVVTVDTSVPGAGYGLVRPEQLDRLRLTLEEAAGRDVVIVLHHPPLPAPSALHHGLALQEPRALAEVVRDSTVRVVLSGHYHHHFAGSVAGVPVLVAPGVANDQDVTVPYAIERALVGTGALVVDLAEDGTVWSTPVPVPLPDDGREVFTLDEAAVARIVEAAGPGAGRGPGADPGVAGDVGTGGGAAGEVGAGGGAGAGVGGGGGAEDAPAVS